MAAGASSITVLTFGKVAHPFERIIMNTSNINKREGVMIFI